MAKRLSLGTPPARSFPYQPFPDAVLLAVVRATRQAWAPIADEERKCAKTDERSELQLNADLAIEMDALRRQGKIPQFNTDVFETPVPDAPTRDYTGEHISTRPDITIRLRDLRPLVADPTLDAIFLECKRLRQAENLGLYFKSGMKRFLDGAYAWAVQQAIMVGYVETDQELPHDLETRLMRNGKDAEMQLVLDARSRPVRPSGKRYLAYTRHQRKWEHLNKDVPGDIELLHVWLSRWE